MVECTVANGFETSGFDWLSILSTMKESRFFAEMFSKTRRIIVFSYVGVGEIFRKFLKLESEFRRWVNATIGGDPV